MKKIKSTQYFLQYVYEYGLIDKQISSEEKKNDMFLFSFPHKTDKE